MNEETTRKRLIQTAALLFQQKGYNGVGVAEILSCAGAPKGSLYHHFPDGKADLARAAAEWMSEGMLQIIDDAFLGKTQWQDGVAHFVAKLAKLFDAMDHKDSCPIKAMLFDGPEDTSFKKVSEDVVSNWQNRLVHHAVGLGLSKSDAEVQAETLLVAIEGGWTLARIRRDSGVLRRIPRQFF